MAQLARPADPLPPDYRGLPEIFEFTNWDGRHPRFNCGQAAACTFLVQRGILKADGKVMPAIERAFPPDNFGGYLGTSRRCVEHICRAHGVRLESPVGENELRWRLSNQWPVMVMLGVAGPRVWKWNLPVGHWMVAYGFDSDFIYLTNFGRMAWADFRLGWRSLVPRLISMRERGLGLAA